MASENIGSVYPTKIPGYDDAADIQAALRLYHYGVVTPPANEAALEPASVAGYLKVIREDITTLEAVGVGSDYSATEPTSPVNGFIWVDSDTSPGALNTAVAAYQTSAPSNPITGSLWVDSTNTNALVLKVYDGTTWKAIS